MKDFVLQGKQPEMRFPTLSHHDNSSVWYKALGPYFHIVNQKFKGLYIIFHMFTLVDAR